MRFKNTKRLWKICEPNSKSSSLERSWFPSTAAYSMNNLEDGEMKERWKFTGRIMNLVDRRQLHQCSRRYTAKTRTT